MVDLSYDLLKRLVEAPAPPGFEDRVRRIVLEVISDLGFEAEVDSPGNVYVKVGNGQPITLIAAHMDEVGFMVKGVTSRGFLKVVSLGGINPSTAIGSEVVVMGDKGDLAGIVGSIPPHIAGREGREMRIEDLFIDIGASSAEEAEEMGVTKGSPITFMGRFRESGRVVMGKAFDDRLGCFTLLEALKTANSPEKGTVYVVFTVQEEVGTRGAAAAALRVKPDYGIAVEGTLATDTPGIPKEDWVTELGKGPAIRVMDATLVANRRLVNHVVKLAEDAGIRVQYQLSPKSGTDAGRFSLTGAASTAISIPTRYVHSPIALALKEDVESTAKLLSLLIEHPFP